MRTTQLQQADKKIIAVDCDDCLVQFNRKFVEFYNRLHGTHFEFDHMTTYDIHLVYGCSEAELTAIVWEFYDSPDHAAMEAMEGAIEAMTYLAAHPTLVPAVVTSRVEQLEHVTARLLHGHFGEIFHAFHFANHYGAKPGQRQRSKSEICEEIGAICFVDDALHHAEAVAKTGIPVLMPDRPWNRDRTPEGVLRVRDWHEALVYIKEKF